MAGTPYEAELEDFARRMNRVLSSSMIKVELVKITAPCISRMLFRNNTTIDIHPDCGGKCIICKNGALNFEGSVMSNITGKPYKISKKL